MSRRLDALFAARVLGCEVIWGEKEPECYCESCPHDVTDELGDAVWPSRLKSFTTSLDAAWEGVEKVTLEGRKAHCRDGLIFCLETEEHDSDGAPSYMVAWGDYRPEECGLCVSAAHPALAIVLACLRAVGVSEEEIEEAGRPGQVEARC